jgi:hypothetical protein
MAASIVVVEREYSDRYIATVKPLNKAGVFGQQTAERDAMPHLEHLTERRAVPLNQFIQCMQRRLALAVSRSQW